MGGMVSLGRRVIGRLRRILSIDGHHRLYLVNSAPLPERYFTGPNGQELYSSAFNPAWFSELGVVASTIVDIGSFDGGDAQRFRNAFPTARVITVEADPGRAKLVREALAGTAVEVLECAIHAKDENAQLYRTEIDGIPSSQGSLYQFDERSKVDLSYIKQAETPLTVIGRSLESVATELGIGSISLLHMDIQGAEYEALLGLGELRPTLIYLEVDAPYVGIRNAKDLHYLLKSMGYELAADFVSDRLYALRTRGRN
ncbi:FkbM family methyltransferase [Devosia faecipullorum]|uniref:FkbM family methyltransferase n=1 Tax=Devosia faecipullorum TaxID=2755039 RepID=UPI00187B9C04|nr:FkbM family methyltransferase [Devosia faecipullorum]MBE7734534.1 FkbM family methyltransferase [Devosia faecipullorum]